MLFTVYIVFWPNTVSKYQTWTNSYLIPLMLKCSERCRETQEREPAHTGWCLVIQSQKFPRYFEITEVITELIYLLISAAMVSMMFRRLILIHFFCHFLAIRLYHEFLSQLNCHFDIAFFEHYLLQTTAAKQANEILWNFTYPHWNTS